MVLPGGQAAPEPQGRAFSLVEGEPFDPRRIDGARGDPPFSVFRAEAPVHGRTMPQEFLAAGSRCVEAAILAAGRAAPALARKSPAARAGLLRSIAGRIEDAGDGLITVGAHELGQSKVRMRMERDRASAMLRSLADLTDDGVWIGASIRVADRRIRPPVPDVRRMLRSRGPVAVLLGGWSPFLHGAAGVDAASALAAGCSVIVRSGPVHPHTDLAVARLITEAVAAADLDPGSFALLLSGEAAEADIARRLVTDEGIAGVAGHCGRAEATEWRALGTARNTVIPVEVRTPVVNPIFVLPAAIESSCEPIARRLAAAIADSCGQQPSRPGLIMAVGVSAASLVHAIGGVLGQIRPRPIASRRRRDGFLAHLERLMGVSEVQVRGGAVGGPRREYLREGPITALPLLFRAPYRVLAGTPLMREAFEGPAAIVVACSGEAELLGAASLAPECGAASIFAGARDAPLAQRLAATLERYATRISYNDVAAPAHAADDEPAAMMLTRWCRMVRYQNAADGFLPAELRNANPLGIPRTIDGTRTRGAVPLRIAA